MESDAPPSRFSDARDGDRGSRPQSNAVATPSIVLPKGGGAVRAIDEKFSVNAANGTCELTIALPFSKTRSGLDGSVALRYSSGSGNSAFGLGWSLSLPSIARRTDRQLPRYEDAHDSDVFVIAGAEDLVPRWSKREDGAWAPDVMDIGNVHVRRYCPRIEGNFSRIERISIDGERGFFWKVTTRDNIVTIYGRTAAARIADPADDTRIFRWLPEWTYDDKGNCSQFSYKPEDLDGTPDVVEERNRRTPHAFANTYLKGVRYGNKNPYLPDPATPFDPAPPANPAFFFEGVFDYGEHDDAFPTPDEESLWPCRYDPFSDYRGGFDIRTYRLCRRILFFHHFTELNLQPAPQAEPYLVRSVDLHYRQLQFDGAPHRREEADFITAVERVHYRKTGVAVYDRRSIPLTELHYHEPEWNKTVSTISPEDVTHAPAGTTTGYQWVDLDGFGAPGILAEDVRAWYYKTNLGDGHFSRAAEVTPKPSLAGASTGALQFRDLDADGRKQVVSSAPGLRGYFELDDDDAWQPFRSFEQVANVDTSDPNVRLLDLDGDGKADLLISEESVFRWYPSLGTRGFDRPYEVGKQSDEERGPALVFADGTETIFIADMSGDGLADIVRIRNAEVCYWPNLGYGRFGAKVTMANAPLLDDLEAFDPRAIQLADVSGTGASDLIYLGGGKFRAWLNLSGNGWSGEQVIEPFPGTERPNRIAVFDLLGNGTASLVWSSELPANATAPIRYVDLMGGRKPYIIDRYTNNLGAQTNIEYRSSTHYALLDERDGRAWVTKLPFPTMCVSRTEVRDSVSGSQYVREFRYRHGYYDHEEREFRGFGMVEETDSESFDRFRKSGASNVVPEPLHQPPRRTRTWFHTGAFVRGGKILHAFGDEYFKNAANPEQTLPELVIESDQPLTPDEMREAARACKSIALRVETYADDDSPNDDIPYTTSTHNCHLQLLQPALGNRYAVFLPRESEAITYHYERDLSDPRVAHTLNTVIDEIGNVRQSASVVYGRQFPDAALPVEARDAQQATRIVYTVHRYTNDVATNASYRLRALCETRVYELTGVAPAATTFSPEEIRLAFDAAAPLEYDDPLHPGASEKRLLRRVRTRFASDADPNVALPFESLQSLGLHYEDYRLALTTSLLDTLYGGKVTPLMLGEGSYAAMDGAWWIPSGIVRYPANPEQHFYLPDRYVDARGSATSVRYYSDYHLLIDRTEDALGSQTTALEIDFRVLQTRSMRDVNDNITDVSFDILGLVAAFAQRGKGNEADDLAGFIADLPAADIDAFLADPEAHGAALLQHATSRFVYRYDVLPAVAATIDRETHHRAALLSGVPSKLRYTFEYSDGLGHVAMQKIQAEPGMAKHCDVHADGTYTITEVDTTPHRRWVGSGRAIVTNKGNRVMEYEPYFSATPGYETAPELVESGVTPVLFYDALDRLIRTDFPEGTSTRIEFDSWLQRNFDQHDTILASDWYAARIGGALGPFERDAALKAELHDGTPQVVHLDSLARAVFTVDHNRFVDRATGLPRNERYETFAELDVEGNRLRARDPRNVDVMRWAFDMAGVAGRTVSADSGTRWMLNDVLGKPLYSWDENGNRFFTDYDVLHRPTRHDVLTGAGTIVFERADYGADKLTNANAKLIRQRDGAGVVEHGPFDFRGNVLHTRRQFTANAAGPMNWDNPAAVALQPALEMTNEYDALDRVVRSVSADGSVTRPRYSEANLVAGIAVSIRGGAERSFIDRITHNEKGQRLRIEYANGVATDVTYDPYHFRTTRIKTVTAAGVALQDLNYTIDAAGNVTTLRDLAQQAVFFNNQLAEPHQDFTYDAIYRLVKAAGREHAGQNAPVSRRDSERTALPHRNDGNAMQRYEQWYEYDGAGNMTAMVHNAGLGAMLHRWTRTFTPAAANNQLMSSAVGAAVENYTYDLQGNLDSAPGLALLESDFQDRLSRVTLGPGSEARYAYDTDGRRARKVVDFGGGVVEERLYAGAAEIFTRRINGVVQLRRETLHVMDGTHRMAIVDTRTDVPEQLIRFQFANNIETASLEVDDHADVISYEEYYPFGSTSFQSVDSARDVPAKRYRYTAKERDEETGLYYYGARYYAPWLARWTAADPAGVRDGTNRYQYVHDNPVRYSDVSGKTAGEGSWWDRHGTQVVGVLQIAGGVMEIAAGAAGLAAPTGVTQVLGAAAVVHGADTLTTGIHTLLSGRVQDTLTQQAATGTARGLGASEQTAQRIGVGVDFVAGVVPSAGVGIARTAATRGAVEATTQIAAHSAPEVAAHSAPAAVVEATTHAAPAVGAETATHAAPAVVRETATQTASHAAPQVATHAAPSTVRAATQTVRATAARAAVRTVTQNAGQRAAARYLAQGGESLLRVRIFDAVERALVRNNAALARAIAQRDVAYLRNLGLRPDQIRSLLSGTRRYAAVYGQAMELAMRRSISRSQFLREFFEFIGNRAGVAVPGLGRPDFAGRALLQGMIFDLTTWAGRAAHYGRYYGRRMMVFGYTR